MKFLRAPSGCAAVCQFTCGTPKLQARARGFYIYNWGGVSLPSACDRDTEVEWDDAERGGSVRKRRLDLRNREKECGNEDGDTLKQKYD